MERLQEVFAANPILVVGFVGLTVALVVNEIRMLFRGFKSVSPAQLTELINRENALVVDLRGAGDFEKGHIIGSRHLLPSEVVPGHKLLAKAGFKRVSVLDGGIGAWQSAGLPLARGKA